MATLADVARRAGVSAATASRVINASAKPPTGAAFTQRRFKSKKGHMLTFDDGDADLIELKSHGGNVVTLDDANKKLVVQSTQGYTVTLDQNGMELKVGGRKIAITPSTIELT